MLTTIDSGCADEETVACYRKLLMFLPRTESNPGLVGDCLLVKDYVAYGDVVIEYTGNRISGRDFRRMSASFDHHGVHPDVQVPVPSERTVIDLRLVANIEKKVNHHCLPNAKLMELKVINKTLVCIVAIRNTSAGEEVFLHYNYQRRNTFQMTTTIAPAKSKRSLMKKLTRIRSTTCS